MMDTFRHELTGLSNSHDYLLPQLIDPTFQPSFSSGTFQTPSITDPFTLDPSPSQTHAWTSTFTPPFCENTPYILQRDSSLGLLQSELWSTYSNSSAQHLENRGEEKGGGGRLKETQNFIIGDDKLDTLRYNLTTAPTFISEHPSTFTSHGSYIPAPSYPPTMCSSLSSNTRPYISSPTTNLCRMPTSTLPMQMSTPLPPTTSTSTTPKLMPPSISFDHPWIHSPSTMDVTSTPWTTTQTHQNLVGPRRRPRRPPRRQHTTHTTSSRGSRQSQPPLTSSSSSSPRLSYSTLSLQPTCQPSITTSSPPAPPFPFPFPFSSPSSSLSSTSSTSFSSNPLQILFPIPLMSFTTHPPWTPHELSHHRRLIQLTWETRPEEGYYRIHGTVYTPPSPPPVPPLSSSSSSSTLPHVPRRRGRQKATCSSQTQRPSPFSSTCTSNPSDGGGSSTTTSTTSNSHGMGGAQGSKTPWIMSCIHWKSHYFFTSVDFLSLMNQIMQVPPLNVETKNRMRRNLETFRPYTVAKKKKTKKRKQHAQGHQEKADAQRKGDVDGGVVHDEEEEEEDHDEDEENNGSSELFTLIMQFGDPKPRKIEKDVKVFPWHVLELAITKILSKNWSGKEASSSSIFSFQPPNKPPEPSQSSSSTCSFPWPSNHEHLQVPWGVDPSFPFKERNGQRSVGEHSLFPRETEHVDKREQGKISKVRSSGVKKKRLLKSKGVEWGVEPPKKRGPRGKKTSENVVELEKGKIVE
ncbi:hypothetical protein HMI54_000962 [Coelomomyces lativittatus]|nr:hypothetical protein HMI54_000962 [Coelomomyces lativittatus]